MRERKTKRERRKKEGVSERYREEREKGGTERERKACERGKE